MENGPEHLDMVTLPSDKGATVLSLYKGLWHLLKPSAANHIRGLGASYIFSMGRVAASLAIPYFLAIILDKVLPERNLAMFFHYSWIIIICFAVFFISSSLMTYFGGLSLEKIFLDLRGRLMSSLMKKPARFFDKYETGDIINRVSNETETLSFVVFDSIFPNLHQATMVMVFVVFMMLWNWKMGLYTTLSLPLYILMVSLFQKPLSHAAKTAREKLSEQTGVTLDIISGMKEIRFYQKSVEGTQRFMKSASQFTKANTRSIIIGEFSYNSMELFTRAISLLPFLLGGYWIAKGIPSFTIGELVAYNIYMTYIADILVNAISGITRLVQSSPLVKRMQEILDYPEEEILRGKDTSSLMETTRIEYRNISFSRATYKPILRDYSLIIEPGEKVAIIGPSGAGKSTLIDLLTRHIEPEQGEILFDGRPISSYSLPIYLQHFAYVRQAPYLFRTTIRENIATGWYDVPLDIVIDAAKRVHIHDAIMKMPQGYDTVIGTAGSNLSDGQRQRIALARAMVRDPEILLLDEFTSALDHATEEAILDDLFTSFDKQTIICVTHSQSVASRFDRIEVIEKL